MKPYGGMKAATTVAGVMLLITMYFTPASAQLPTSFCWDRIMTCRTGAMSQGEFLRVCCPVVSQIVSNETPCFCSIQTAANATVVNQVNLLLGVCSVTGSVDSICNGVTPTPFGAPSPAPTSPGSNLNPSGVPPAASPSSDLTPSGTPPALLSPSEEPSAPPTLVEPPLGDEPSAPPTRVEPPLETPPTLAPAPSPIGFTPENSPPQNEGATSKITMAGSLSGVIFILAYILI